MPKRDRNHRRALVALAIIIGGAVLAGLFGFLEQAQRNAYREPTEQSASAEYKKNWWEDTLPQWLMAVFAIAATLVGIWTILLLRDTVVATRRGNRDARLSAERQLRAYISVRPLGMDNLKMSQQMIAHIGIKNVGQTPAQKVTVALRAVAFGSKEPGRVAIDLPSTAADRTIQPQAEFIQGTKETFPELPPSDGKQRNYFFVWGVVSYVDIFDKPHLTYFCHRYDLDTRHRDGERHFIDEKYARYHYEGNSAT